MPRASSLGPGAKRGEKRNRAWTGLSVRRQQKERVQGGLFRTVHSNSNQEHHLFLGVVAPLKIRALCSGHVEAHEAGFHTPVRGYQLRWLQEGRGKVASGKLEDPGGLSDVWISNLQPIERPFQTGSGDKADGLRKLIMSLS